MEAITLSANGDSLSGEHLPARKVRAEHRIPHRWYIVMVLHLKGAPHAQIAEVTGYNPTTISIIIHHPRMVAVRQQLMRELNDDFEAQYFKVIDRINDALNNQDPNVYLKGADMWLKAHGKYDHSKQANNQVVNITAEDVVMQILQNGNDKK